MIDIRNIGLVAGVQLAPNAEGPGRRGYKVFEHCFKNGTLVRVTGDIIAMSPPLIVEKQHIDQMINTLADAIKAIG